MRLQDLGWNSFFEAHFAELNRAGVTPARVVEAQRGLYRVRTEHKDYLAEPVGRLLNSAHVRADLPAVGDWVLVMPRPNESRTRIEAILPRKTKLSRKVAGRESLEQVIAANLDTVFVVCSLNRDFNLRRIERYLALVWDSGARPVVLLTKSDLSSNVARQQHATEQVALGVPVHAMSALQGHGLEALHLYLGSGQTVALVGSSGAGKSTLINRLVGEERLRVQATRTHDDRGRHTTTSRQLVVLSGGALLIDTPGMRELQLFDNETGVAQVFDDVEQLARQCRFRDCSHQTEPGCAVQAAIASKSLDVAHFENYLKLLAELRFQERRMNPALERDEKERWKKIHKAMRHLPEKF